MLITINAMSRADERSLAPNLEIDERTDWFLLPCQFVPAVNEFHRSIGGYLSGRHLRNWQQVSAGQAK
jgi:hypothetical protein